MVVRVYITVGDAEEHGMNPWYYYTSNFSHPEQGENIFSSPRPSVRPSVCWLGFFLAGFGDLFFFLKLLLAFERLFDLSSEWASMAKKEKYIYSTSISSSSLYLLAKTDWLAD